MSSIGVIGVGNVLMRDDGFGPCAIEALQSQYGLSESVTLCDAGTPGLGFMADIATYDAIIVFDTVRVDGPPGEIRCFRRAELLSRAPATRLAPHDPSLIEALHAANWHAGRPTEVLLIGVKAETVEVGVGLSAPVAAAVDEAVAMAVHELRRLGVGVEQRDEPLVQCALFAPRS